MYNAGLSLLRETKDKKPVLSQAKPRDAAKLVV